MIKELIPPNLLADENIKALIESIEPEFEKVKNEIINVLIYPRIDELNEEVLDLLAYQFHIEGYDLATSIEEKRNLIKKSIELHKYKGTKYAIEQVLKALGLEGQIKEWFEYGGKPYYFKIEIDINKTLDRNIVLSNTVREKLTKLINEYKNLRSKLEDLRLKVVEETNLNLFATKKEIAFTKLNLKQSNSINTNTAATAKTSNSINTIAFMRLA